MQEDRLEFSKIDVKRRLWKCVPGIESTFLYRLLIGGVLIIRRPFGKLAARGAVPHGGAPCINRPIGHCRAS